MGKSRQRKVVDSSESGQPRAKRGKEDCDDGKENTAKDRRHDFSATDEGKKEPKPRSKSIGAEELEKLFGKAPVLLHDPSPPVRLIGPTQSPRDPNLYRVIRLANGIRISLTSNCAFNLEDLTYLESVRQQKADGRVRTGTRSKCRRATSDMDTPSSKRSRPAKKDANCLDIRIGEFNKEVLHLCETPAECLPAKPGPTAFFSFFCCGPNFFPPNENLDVEGTADQPLPDPALNSARLENEVVEKKGQEGEEEESPPEVRINPWNKPDPDEDDETPETSNCSQLLLDGLFNVSSVAITVPWGPLNEPDDAPGIGLLARNCLDGCDHTSPNTEEETSTFMIYFRPADIERDVGCLSQKFHPPVMRKDCVDSMLAHLTEDGTFIDRLRTKCWSHGSQGILNHPKRIKLMTLLSKPEHPIRKVGLGGKIDKKLTELARNTIDRGLLEFLRNNCKPEYMTVGIEAPLPLAQLEELAVKHFNKAGLLIPETAKPELRRLTGEPDPFDTAEFRKLYRVSPCPTGECTNGECTKSTLILSFPLPPETWKNYKTKPLLYFSYMIGHRGIGSLYAYLDQKAWITDMEAKSTESSYHHNQFVTMFEILLQLTEDGFDEIQLVLKAVFSYLRMLSELGPSKRVFKELQRLAAIDFHSLGQNIDDLTVLRGAHHLSKALHFALSTDIILYPNIMTEFNGPLLRDLQRLFVPSRLNIMLVSNQHSADLKLTENFLKTKYGVEEIPAEWTAAWDKISVYPEFTAPQPNLFIPENFCMFSNGGGEPGTGPNVPRWIEGDDFHDLWHMPDSRYKTKAGCIIHFVSPLSMRNSFNATQNSLFKTMFKKALKPVLWPAKLGGLSYKIKRTEFGILVKLEVNRDKIGLVVGAMASVLHTFQDSLDEDKFAMEKALHKQYICCQLKKPCKLAGDIFKTLTLQNAWLHTESLPVLDKLTLAQFKAFVEDMKRDLYFMILVVGNATIQEADELVGSILSAMKRKKVTSKKIEPIKVLQWPPGEKCVRVKSFDKHNKRTLLVNHYQIGVADRMNVTCAKLIEPLLQKYFFMNSGLLQKNLHVMLSVTQAHNVLEMALQVWFPVDKGLTPERVDEELELSLDRFQCEVLEKIKKEGLEDLKKTYLCDCQTMCSWFSSGHDINHLAQGVRALTNFGTKIAQSTECVCLKPDALVRWFGQVMLDPEPDTRCSSSAPTQRRKLQIIVTGNLPEPPEEKRYVPTAKPTETSVPAAKLVKVEKDKPKTCGRTTCQALLSKFKRTVELSFDMPKKSEPAEPKKEQKKKQKQSEEVLEAQETVYVTNFKKFKGSLFKYPTYAPAN